MSRQSTVLFDALANLDPELVLAAAPIPAEAQHKKRRPLWVMVAAVIAVAALLMGAAGILNHYFSLGGFAVESTEHHFSIDLSAKGPVEAKDGRLYLEIDGERTDITDLVDAHTAYLYTAYNASGQVFSHILAGGTPEDYGWVEIWFDGAKQRYVWAGKHGEMSGSGLLGEDLELAGAEEVADVMDCPWIADGVEQILATAS